MTEENSTNIALDVNQIKELIPHRFPFLLVDRVLSIDLENLRLTAIKNVTVNEPFFVGHYPDLPVMPGVLQVEAMAQAACIFLLRKPENKGKVPFFTGIDGVKFRRQVVPGDQLRIEVQVVRLKPRVAKCQVQCLVEGAVTAEALLTCMLGDAE
jgi:3-hydroxyacyl-[acyl-carrier-protein] dehydratase